MKTNIKSITFVLLAALFGLSGCKKTEFAFGDLITPSGVTLTTAVAGVDAANPGGNGTGAVTITVTAANAITYKVDFGDGNSKILPAGTITYKYTNPGTFDYTISANAIGTGGTTSTLSKKVKVYVKFAIPTAIVDGLTGGTSKTWVLDKTNAGMFGMGPEGGFADIWWKLDPNNAADMLEKEAAMDDEVTFTLDPLGNILMTVDNKGATFMNGDCVPFYGFAGSTSGGYPLNTGGTKKLTFMDATSASTPDISTRIQFDVPGNGIIIFGVSATRYEILQLSNSILYLQCAGSVTPFSWFQRLKPKP